MTSIPANPLSESVLGPVGQFLPQILAELSPDSDDTLSVEPLDLYPSEDARRVSQVDGPEDVSFRIELELFSVREDFFDLYVNVEDGDSRHFTRDVQDEESSRNALKKLTRAIAFFVLREIEQRRIKRSSSQPLLSDVSPHVPLLILDKNGIIQDLTRRARHVMEQSADVPIAPSFFSHLHGQNLHRVMRDLAHMVTHGKQRAQWLLRIRTGTRRWRWCRVHAENHLSHPEESIRVLLRPI